MRTLLPPTLSVRVSVRKLEVVNPMLCFPFPAAEASMSWVRVWSTRYLAVTGARVAGLAAVTAARAVHAKNRATIVCPLGVRKLGGPPDQVRRAAAGRAVSRVLFPALARLGWSSVWDGRRRPPLAAYPRLVLSVWVTPRRLFGLAPTGGYRAAAVTSGAVGSYPTVSPLPLPRLRLTHTARSRRSILCGPVRRLSAPRRYL